MATVPRRKREEVPFTWFVTCGMPTYSALAGVRFDRTFLDLDGIVEAFTTGEPKARELYGPGVRYSGPGWSGISYGHVNCLGSELTFPEDSEVAHKPIYESLTEGIKALQQKVDWASAGMMPFFLDLWEGLKKAFPDRKISFGGFGLEGPITTGWELRGHDYFADPYDDPERYGEFMYLVTESIVAYGRFIRSLNGDPPFVEGGMSLYDDLASLFGPASWPEWVLPYHEQYFRLQTSGRRRAHIENLTPDHLHFLDELGLDTFDPGVTPGITAADLRDRCHTSFQWRFNGMQLRDFSHDQIRRYVFKGVADGASNVFCNLSRTMIEPEAVEKVFVFIKIAKEIAQLLSEGCPRNELMNH